MSSFIIEGGRPLSGEIVPQGAKNEALQVISATLLTSREVLIDNVPEISDVKNLIELLRMMGVKVERHARESYSFCASDIDTDYVLSADFVRRCAALRGSVLVVGPILGRFGKAYFPKPGGDKIGRRKVDTHIQGFVNLGATYTYEADKKAYLLESAGSLKGTYMLLDEASVTGTANIIPASPNSFPPIKRHIHHLQCSLRALCAAALLSDGSDGLQTRRHRLQPHIRRREP